MKRFRVTYQETPFAHTSAHVLIVEAETRVEASIAAFDALTQRGHHVAFNAYALQRLGFTPEEYTQAMAAFPPTDGRTYVTEAIEYDPKTTGRVVEG